MTVCVIGSGAREHALSQSIARSVDVICSPGNPGIIGTSLQGHALSSSSAPPEEIEADLYVIGPEVPLVEGLADRLRAKGKLVFGPGADGAALEGSKAFMKAFVAQAGVPTAAFRSFTDAEEACRYLTKAPAPYVIKTDGLAAGKGVLVTSSLDEARLDVRAKLAGTSFGDAGRRIVIEDPLSGPEISLLVLVDGHRAVTLPAAQDFKRVGARDLGPNTGGMGAYSPVLVANEGVIDQVMDQIIEPTLGALKKSGIDYRGVLYAGCMLGPDGPKLVEYNVRFGDPETEVVLPRLEGDIAQLLAEVAAGCLTTTVKVGPDAAVCVVAASQGYPESPRVGDLIHGLDVAGTVEGVQIFHAGTARDVHGNLLTSGGRVLVVTGLGPSISQARSRAYRAIEQIEFKGMHYRPDIGLGADGLSSEGITS